MKLNKSHPSKKQTNVKGVNGRQGVVVKGPHMPKPAGKPKGY